MPELPEVETTVRGLQKKIVGKTIQSVWSNYQKKDHVRKEEIKNLSFFNGFKKKIVGSKIEAVKRRGKNILIHLDNEFVILTHMKMTGHFLFGKYKKTKEAWEPLDLKSDLGNSFSRHVRFVLEFTDSTHLALSDARKFAKITIVSKSDLATTPHLNTLGTEILSPSFTNKIMKEKLQTKSAWPIKTALMEQSLFVGIGNIYADELLWLASVHPERLVSSLEDKEFNLMYKNVKPLLQKGIALKGNSTSDYRTVDGTPGKFQEHQKAYQNTGLPCSKRECSGIIQRVVVRGRSSHYCSKHQK
ncbi:MAG: formamidopyrimidine-DNA glycosylase [Candidatus Paceibacteria bacterium]|jgi:formamidopyrimidine-DNA glycosylase